VTVVSDVHRTQIVADKFCDPSLIGQYDLRTANGHSLAITAVADLPIKVGQLAVRQRCIFVKGLAQAAIVGVDLMKKLGACIDFDAAMIHLSQGWKVSFLSRDGMTPAVQTLKVANTCSIPPLSVAIIKVKTSRTSQSNMTGEVEHMWTEKHDDDLIVSPGLVVIRKGVACIEVINTSCMPMGMQRNEPVALFRVADSEMQEELVPGEPRQKMQVATIAPVDESQIGEVLRQIDFSKVPEKVFTGA